MGIPKLTAVPMTAKDYICWCQLVLLRLFGWFHHHQYTWMGVNHQRFPVEAMIATVMPMDHQVTE